jgi:hypothetical protein
LWIKTVIYWAVAVTYGDVGTVAYSLGYELLGMAYSILYFASTRYVCRYGG